jgi:hypothetical protein
MKFLADLDKPFSSSKNLAINLVKLKVKVIFSFLRTKKINLNLTIGAVFHSVNHIMLKRTNKLAIVKRLKCL